MLNNSTGVSPIISLVFATAFWGIATVISKGVLASVSPIAFLVAQLAPSVLVLWVVVVLTRAKPVPTATLVPIALLGCLNPGLSYTFSIMGLALTTASVASLLWAAEPAFIVAMAWCLLAEKLGRRRIAATASAALGVLLVSGLVTGASLGGNGWGDCLVLAGVICCAAYTVFSRKIAASADPLFIVALQQTAGLVWALALLPLEARAGTAHSVMAMSKSEWIGAAASGLMYYFAAFWCYLIGLRSLPASIVAGFLNLTPLFAIGAAYLVLGERLDPSQWIGAAIVLASVLALLVWATRPDVQTTSRGI